MRCALKPLYLKGTRKRTKPYSEAMNRARFCTYGAADFKVVAALIALAFCLLLSCSSAQVRGVLSFVDLDPTPPELFEDCLSYAPDGVGILECTTGVEIVDEEKRVACLNQGGNCERYAFNIPMYPDKLGLTVEKVYKELWDRYVEDVNEYAKDKMKEAGCWAAAYPTTVLSQVILYAHTEAAVRYWKEVFIASLYYMPASLWWHSPFPGDGGVFVPSYSLLPKPQLYEDLAASNEAYFFQPPAFPGAPVEIDESDLAEGWPGLYSKEMLKQSFFDSKQTIPTALEYNQFGHASFFRAYGRRSMKVFVVFEPTCIPPPLGKSPLGVFPVPFIPRADTEWLSVAEGYPFDNGDLSGDYWVPYPEGAFTPPPSPQDAESLLSTFSGDLLNLLPLGGGLAGSASGLGGGLGSFSNFSDFSDQALESYFNDLGDGYDDILTHFEFGQDSADGLANAGNLTDLDGLNAAGQPADEGADSNEPSGLLTRLDGKLLEVLPEALARYAVNELPGGNFDRLGLFEKIRTVGAFSSATEDYIQNQVTVTDAEGNTTLDPSKLGGIASNAGGLESFLGGSESGTSFGAQSFSYGGEGFGGLSLGPGGPDDREDLEEVLNCPALSVKPGERGPYPILGKNDEGIVRTGHYNDATRYLFSGYDVADTYTQDMAQNLQAFRDAFGLPDEKVDTSAWVPSYTILCDGDEGGEVQRLNSMLGGGGSEYDAEEVADFQAENGLEPDGVTGPETWLALAASGGSPFLQTPGAYVLGSGSGQGGFGLSSTPLPATPLLAQTSDPSTADPSAEENANADEEQSPEAEEVSYRNGEKWPRTIKNWFGPDGPFRLDDPEGEDSCQRYTVENPISPFDYEEPQTAQELAEYVLYRHQAGELILATENPANPDTGVVAEPDGSDPLSNVTAALAGAPAKRSNGLASFGGETYLSPDMLEGLLAISDHYQVRVSAVAGGEHSANSPHYGGAAFQIDMIDGKTVEEIAAEVDTDTSVNVINKTYQEGDELKNTCDWGSGESPIVQVLALCGAADAKATSGPTSDTIGRRDHLQCSWPTKADAKK